MPTHRALSQPKPVTTAYPYYYSVTTNLDGPHRENIKLDAFEQAQCDCPDPLAPARGLGWGILFAIPLWLIAVALVWWWLWA